MHDGFAAVPIPSSEPLPQEFPVRRAPEISFPVVREDDLRRYMCGQACHYVCTRGCSNLQLLFFGRPATATMASHGKLIHGKVGLVGLF